MVGLVEFLLVGAERESERMGEAEDERGWESKTKQACCKQACEIETQRAE